MVQVQEDECTQIVHVKNPRRRVIHAENPDNLGTAMCDAKLGVSRYTSAEGTRCIVCLDLIRRSFVSR